MAETPSLIRKAAFWFYALLLFAGIMFYGVWGAVYGSWNLFEARWAGVYAVTVILIGFGLVGILLYRRPRAAPAAKPPQ